MTYCYRVGAPFNPFPDCDTSGNRLVTENAHVEREFELVSAVDLDNDGIINRVYGVETIEFRLGPLPAAIFGADIPACDVLGVPLESGLCTDDGRLRYTYQSSLQSYDLRHRYDINDADGDSVSNEIDASPFDPNVSIDSDGDGIGDEEDLFPDDPTAAYDTDGDGIPNSTDDDDDNDGVLDEDDAFPYDPTESIDTDLDGVGDNADRDIDGDGVSNGNDAFPTNRAESADLDGDGIGNNSDDDIDGDSVPNSLDAFPYDPSETVDTDGDGIGDNRDEDDDNDGIPDASDVSPRGDGYLDDDGDGVFNKDDFDRDGNGVADFLDPLISGDVPFVVMSTRPDGFDGAIPDFRTGNSPSLVKLMGDGTHVTGRTYGTKESGTWGWDEASQSLTFEGPEPFQFTDTLYSEEAYTNIDWDVYNELGRPELTIDRYSTDRLTWTQSADGYSVTQDSGLTEFAVGIADGFNLSEIVIDPSLPIRDVPLGSEPGFGAIVFSQFDIIPMSREDILGEWGMNVILPGAIDECSTDNGAERRCGVILRFNDTGVGYAGDRAFEWTATEFGAIAIEMADGSGSLKLGKVREYHDGSIAVLSEASAGGDSFLQQSLAVKRDFVSLLDAASYGAFENVPLANGFSITDPQIERDEAGIPYETFGFVLNSDGSMANFNTYNLDDNPGWPGSYRVGEWSDDGYRITKNMCLYTTPIGGEPHNYSNNECPNDNIYRRTWDLLSAVDLDGDDLFDRFYAIETAQRLDAVNFEQCADGSTSCTEDGRPLVWNFNRINFYERLPGFNIADVDKDGTENGADGAPFDPTEQADSDGDGIGNNKDPDDDNDGIEDGLDNCPLVANEDQADSDGDGLGDACDDDDDNDGRPDASDAFPFDPTETHDSDGDGVGNNADADDDNDNISDLEDPRPYVAACPLGTSEVPLEFLGDYRNNPISDEWRSVAPAVCVLPSEILTDLTLDERSDYVISGPVVVGNGHNELGADGSLADGSPRIDATLTIPAGTQIYAIVDPQRPYDAEWDYASYLQITRGSKLNAEGTREKPIVISDEWGDYGGYGQWGGLVLQGSAPQTGCDSVPCNIETSFGYVGGRY